MSKGGFIFKLGQVRHSPLFQECVWFGWLMASIISEMVSKILIESNLHLNQAWFFKFFLSLIAGSISVEISKYKLKHCRSSLQCNLMAQEGVWGHLLPNWRLCPHFPSPPVWTKKWQKPAIFDKFVTLCPLMNHQQKCSGVTARWVLWVSNPSASACLVLEELLHSVFWWTPMITLHNSLSCMHVLISRVVKLVSWWSRSTTIQPVLCSRITKSKIKSCCVQSIANAQKI